MYDPVSEIAASFPGVRLSRICWNKVTSLGAGTAEQLCCTCDGSADVPAVIQHCIQHGLRIIPLGAGSNFIGSDEPLSDVILFKLSECMEHHGAGIFLASGGASLMKVIRFALSEGFGGASALSGIPGSVGGAIRMNAGARGVSTSAFIRNITAVNLQNGIQKTFLADDLTWGYRSCSLAHDWLILRVELVFQPVERSAEEQLIAEEKEKRKGNPQGRSAGSIFRNPGGSLSAGQLLESVSMKGQTVGAWHVSEQHGNWIIGTGQGGSAADAAALIQRMRLAVWKTHRILLEPEVFFVNKKEQKIAMQQ